MRNLTKSVSKKFLSVLMAILMMHSMIPVGLIAYAEEGIDYSFSVSDSAGDVIEGASIEVAISEGVSKTGTTDESGNATVTDLEEGDYVAKVTADGYCTKNVAISVSTTSTSSDVELAKEITVSGNVTSSDNEAAENLNVEVTDEMTATVDVQIAGSSYSFKAEEGKSYSLNVSADNCVSKENEIVTAGNQDITKDFELSLKVQVIEIEITGKGTVAVNGETKDNGNKATVTVKSGTATVAVNADAVAGYHISSVAGVVNYANTATKNSVKNAVVTFTDSFTVEEKNDSKITAVFEINSYDVTLTTSTNGKVSVGTDTVEPTKSVVVEHGGSAFAVVEPNYGYNIKTIKANTTAVKYFAYKTKEYKTEAIKSITEDTEIAVSYEAYGTVDFNSAVVLPTSKKTEGNKYFYNGDVTINAATAYEGMLINGEDGARDTKSKTYQNTITVSKVEVYDADTMKWSKATLDSAIEIIIDRTAPVLELDDIGGNYKNQDVTITGSIEDEGGAGVNKVFYSTEQYSNIEDLKASTKATEVSVATDGKFSVTLSAEQNTVYYFYGYDKSDNLSEVKNITVKIDKTKPIITNVDFSDNANSIVTKIVKFFSFGTITSDDLYVTVTAKDANNPSSSDIESIVLTYKNSKSNGKVDAELVSKTNLVDFATESSKGGTKAVYTFKIAAESLSSVDDFSVLEAVVKDNAGNSSTLADARDDNKVETNANNYDIMVSIADPFASISIDTTEKYTETPSDPKVESKLWYDGDVDFTVDIADIDPSAETQVHSGINSVEIKINGTTVASKVYATNNDTTDDALVKDDTYSVDTSKVDNVEGLNTVSVKVIGNNGKEYETSKNVYIDRNKPVLNSVSIAKEEGNVTEKIIRFLSFGTFFNNNVVLSFTVSDATPTSDLKNVYIYTANTEDESPVYNEIEHKAVVDGKVQFTIKKSFADNVFVKVDDNATNASEITAINEIADDDVESSYLMLEDVKASTNINIDLDKAPNRFSPVGDGVLNKDTLKSEPYYGKTQEVNISFSDNESGLYSASSSMHRFLKDDYSSDESVYEEKADSKVEKFNKFVDKTKPVTESMVNSFDYASNPYVTDGEGKFVFSSKVQDNANNDEVTAEKTFYVDTYAPQITKFVFGKENYKDEDENNFSGKFIADADGKITYQSYGFYFQEKTDVTIYADDITDSSNKTHESAGIYKIDFVLVNKEGEKIALDEKGIITVNASDGKLDYQYKLVDKNNSIKVEIPKGFKGQIYAKAMDNVGHEGDKVNPYGVVIEDVRSGITFSREEATEKAVNGTDLYNKSISVDFEVTDSDQEEIVSSGIRKVEWAITVPENLGAYYKANNRNGYIVINNKGEISESKVFDVAGKEITDSESYCNWKLTPIEDSNLIHKLVGTVFVQNDSNDIILSVKVTDRSGNESEVATDTFSIDKTAPTVQLTYADNKANNGTYSQYYNFDRVATLTVTERNFDATRIEAALSNIDPAYESCPSIENINTINEKTGKNNWKEKVVSNDPNTNTYEYKINYNVGDGIYDFAVNKIVDLAGNSFDRTKSTYTDRFVIDRTTPDLSVDYSFIDGGKSIGSMPGLYNNKKIRATFKLVDHNVDVIVGNQTLTGEVTRNQDFVSASVVSTNSKAQGVTVNQFPTSLTWKKAGVDTYVATFDLTQEAAYEIKINGADMAGNKAFSIDTPKFTVDTIKPIIKIEGIKQVTYAAYNNEKITPSISLYDEGGNIDESSIKMTVTGTNSNISTLTNHEIFDLATDVFTTRKPIIDGFNYISQYFNNEVETKDDIYTLHVEFKDLANNAVSDNYIFSVNRFGSTYIYNASTASGANFYNNDTVYIQSILGIPLFTEINCDFLEREKTELSLTYTNTAQQKQTQIVLQEGKDYIVSSSPNPTTDAYNIKQYTYQLTNTDLFELDGVYQLFATTYDSATNINKSNQEVGEIAKTQQLMKFVVDKNAPRINSESNFEKYSYEDDEHLIISDNNKLVDEVFSTDGTKASLTVAIDEKNLDLDAIDEKTIIVKYDDKVVDSKVEEVNGVYQCSFDLDETRKGYDLAVTVGDKAGNSNELVVKELLVSNNWFIRYINNTVAVVATVSGVVVAIGAAVAIVIIRKKRITYED